MSTKRTDIGSVWEAKQVLDFLGVEKPKWENEDNFETLLEMVCEQESKLLDKIGVEVVVDCSFKEIFNSFNTMEERKAELAKLCDYVYTLNA